MFKKILTYSLLSLIAVGGFFGNIEKRDDSGKHYIYTQGVFANELDQDCPNGGIKGINGDCPKPTPDDTTKMYNSVIDALNIVLGLITALVSPAIMFAGWLMSPDWTSGDLFGLREPMYKLWVTVSNIVYFVYAILLILIALGTMFGQEKFSYKVMLPKLALGILMVPFTWWFVQWTISLSTIITASVITIPMETISAMDTNGTSWMSTPSIPAKITVDENEKKEATTDKFSEQDCSTKGKCIAPLDVLKNSSGMYGYMMVYAYSVFKFQDVKKLAGTTDIISAGVGIIHQGLIAAIMFLVFGLLTLALVSMLLVRAIKLWVYAIFSPLFTFRFVAGANIMGGDEDTFTLKEFIGLAFVPAIVGITLSFGLIMINAVGSGKTSSTEPPCDKDKIEHAGCTLLQIAGSANNSITRKIDTTNNTRKTVNIVTFGGITTEFIGKAGAAQDSQTEATSVSTVMSVLNSAGGIFGTLIIDIIALVFIWMSFMAAKNVSKAVKAAVDPFEKIGSSIGGMMQKLPQYTPLPIPGGSVKGLGMASQKMGDIVEHSASKRFDDSGIGQFLNKHSGSSAEDVTRMSAALNKHGIESVTELRSIADSIRTSGRGESLYGATQRDNLNKFAVKVKDGEPSEEKLKEIFGSYNGKKLFDLTKGGSIKSDEDAKIVAAILASRGRDETRIDSDTIAIKVLKNEPTAEAPKTLSISINSDQEVAEIVSSIKKDVKHKAFEKTEMETYLKKYVKDKSGNEDTKKIGKIIDQLYIDTGKK